MPTFKKMFGRGKKTAGSTQGKETVSDKASSGTDTKKLQAEHVETVGDCPISICKEERSPKCEEMEMDSPTEENPNWHQAEKEVLQWPPPGVEVGSDQNVSLDESMTMVEEDVFHAISDPENMMPTKNLEDEPTEVPSLRNTLETYSQIAQKIMNAPAVHIPTFSECQDPNLVFGVHQTRDRDGSIALTFSREASPSKFVTSLAEEEIVDAGQLDIPPTESPKVHNAGTVVPRQESPERQKSARRTRRHRREVPTRPEGDEAQQNVADEENCTEPDNINQLPEKPYDESEVSPTRQSHRQVMIKDHHQGEFPAPPAGLPEGEGDKLKVIKEVANETVKPIEESSSKPPSPRKLRRSKATSLSLHRRKRSLENVEQRTAESITAEDVSASSSDELKRTQTLPALIRHVEPEGKKRHSRNRKESSGSRERSGMKKLLARMGSPSEETGSGGATTNATTDKDHNEPVPTARPERTASLLGGWVKASRKKSSSIGPPQNGRSASASAVSGGTQPSSGSETPGAEPGTVVVSRTSSPFASGIDLELLTAELTKLQSELRLLADSNSDTRMRHDSDVALMRKEVGTIVFEITGLKGELERFRQEYAQADLQRKMENAILPLTRTDRSSLTLHCCDAAEMALNEQLARLHDEGPLVPYEGNDLLPTILTCRSNQDDQKMVTWGNRFGRGMGRTFVMVLTGLRQLWYFYLTMYPMI